MDAQVKTQLPNLPERVLSDSDVRDMIAFTKEAFDFDFSGYTLQSLKRRFGRLMDKMKLDSFYDFKYQVVNGDISRSRLLSEITVNVTEMFRDPLCFKTVGEVIFPYLHTFPQCKVWHAGCSTGEEMYSLAILLKESGLLDKTIQYGTDINEEVLKAAGDGIYPIASLKAYSANYHQAGGLNSLSDYYSIGYGHAKLNPSLKKNMVHSTHDLVQGTSFNEFQLIVCRNVLIYFDQELQNRVLELFVESLAPFGYLVLGDKESIAFSRVKEQFETVNNYHRIFRKRM